MIDYIGNFQFLGNLTYKIKPLFQISNSSKCVLLFSESPYYFPKKHYSKRYLKRVLIMLSMKNNISNQLSENAEENYGHTFLKSREICANHLDSFYITKSIDYLNSVNNQLKVDSKDFKSNDKLKRCYSYPCMFKTLVNLSSRQNNYFDKDVFLKKPLHKLFRSVDSIIHNYDKSLIGDNFIQDYFLNNSFRDLRENNLYISCPSSTLIKARNDSTDSAVSCISFMKINESEKAYNTNAKCSIKLSHGKVQHSRSKSDTSDSCFNLKAANHIEITSCPNSLCEDKSRKKKSIFEGQQMIAPTECFFPRPYQGQSLTSFLSSNEFNICAELDRENAHFHISEALIAAIEHIKCSQSMKLIEEDEESDEEIRKLTQRIRIRRKEREREKALKTLVLLSDGKTDTTSQSASPPLSSHSSDFEVDSIGSEDEVDDIELSAHNESNLDSIKENGLSLSMASLYSDADIQRLPSLIEDKMKSQDFEASNLSAELVALSLLRRFSEKQLPKASELQWLVSEKDAPQRLLPLPDSWPVSPDTIEEEYNLEKTRLRGNLEWAPPRPQIIFIIHSSQKRKDIIEKQKYRCAGCGMKIEKSYINRFRYCDYFGKYFCHCCHSNDLAYIPGRILWKWDFTKYYVSKFAWNLLDQMFNDPLFSIVDINNQLYNKIRQLDLCRSTRMQLYYLKDYIRTCRQAEIIQKELEQENSYLICEPNTYSLNDLVQVKNGKLVKQLTKLVNQCVHHIKSCLLCQAKGFICEICNRESDIIFPFQFDKVILCQNCGSCFHKRCYKQRICPRCIRIQERKKRHFEQQHR